MLGTALAGGAAAQQPPASPTGGNYLSSRLVPTKPETACPPGIDALYSSYAIVTGTDMRQRPWGFALTLREVLVKVSGDPRLKDDPHVDEMAAHADQFVACFDYVDTMANTPLHDEQGTYDRPHRLTVFFDPAKIDALLAAIWRHALARRAAGRRAAAARPWTKATALRAERRGAPRRRPARLVPHLG
jgi:hypothetical protein